MIKFLSVCTPGDSCKHLLAWILPPGRRLNGVDQSSYWSGTGGCRIALTSVTHTFTVISQVPPLIVSQFCSHRLICRNFWCSCNFLLWLKICCLYDTVLFTEAWADLVPTIWSNPFHISIDDRCKEKKITLMRKGTSRCPEIETILRLSTEWHCIGGQRKG